MGMKAVLRGLVLVTACSFLIPAHAQSNENVAKLHPSCRAVLDFLSDQAIIDSYGDDFPEALRKLDRNQMRNKMIEMGVLGEQSATEHCLPALKHELSSAQQSLPDYSKIISTMLPASCEQSRSAFRAAMQDRLIDEDGSKVARMVTANDALLLQLNAQNPTATADYCHYASSVWENHDSISAESFDLAQQKFPLPKICDQAYDRIKAEFFSNREKDINDAVGLGMAKANGVLPTFLTLRAYLYYSFINQPDQLEAKCKDVLRL